MCRQINKTGSAPERARLAAMVSLDDAARAVGRHPASIRRYETARTTMPAPVMLTLADLYGVAPAALVGD